MALTSSRATLGESTGGANTFAGRRWSLAGEPEARPDGGLAGRTAGEWWLFERQLTPQLIPLKTN